MGSLDLAAVYLALDREGRATRLPGDHFMARLAAAPPDMAYLVGVYPMTVDWTHWERHPKGDEILFLIDGRLEMTFEQDGVCTTAPLAAGETVVVPAGAWHTARVLEPGRLFAVTYGEGTDHRPLQATASQGRSDG